MMNRRYLYSEADLPTFNQKMKEDGWIIYEAAIDPAFIDEIKESLEDGYRVRRKIQIENGIGDNMNGTLHHLVERENFSLKFLSRRYCEKQIESFLSGKYIINSLGAVINLKNERPYVQNIHRDVRSFTGDFKLMIQMIIVLDDFTIENGATYFLSGSHKQPDKPEEDYFYKHAERAVAPKGSIIMFDANLWHAAGQNFTNQPRRALTMAFTRPFFKQQMDYPRTLGYLFGENLDEHLRQVIGYNSRLPQNLDEYYQPIHKRMYQSGQG